MGPPPGSRGKAMARLGPHLKKGETIEWDPKKKAWVIKKIKKDPPPVHNFKGPSRDYGGDPGDTPFTTNR